MKPEEKPHIDRILDKAGTRLASNWSRRSFLGRLGATASVTLFGGAVLLGEKTESDASSAPQGCYGTRDTQVCYSCWRVLAEESAGVGGVYVRKGPSWNAPIVYNNGHACKVAINEHFCRASLRSTVDQGCAFLGARPSCNGWLWGYRLEGNVKQGWIPYSVGGVTYATGDSNGGPCCGPANVDYDCNRAKSACPSYNGCGGSAALDVTLSVTYRPVNDPDSGWTDGNCDQGYYMRYAAGSVSHGWLVPGDKIRRLAYCTNCAESTDWSCIVAWCCAWLPYGCRGWCRSYVLGSQIDPAPSSCSGSGQCPDGSSF